MNNVNAPPRHVNYEAYLRSPEWKEKRWQVKHRAHGRCENPECGVLLRKGWHCHHLTYVRLGNELLEDLQALCEHCHRELHGLKMLPSPSKRPKKIRKKWRNRFGRKKRQPHPRNSPQEVMLTASELKRRRLTDQPAPAQEIRRLLRTPPIVFTPTKDLKPWNENHARVSEYNPLGCKYDSHGNPL